MDEVHVLHVLRDPLEETQGLVEGDGHCDLGQLLEGGVGGTAVSCLRDPLPGLSLGFHQAPHGTCLTLEVPLRGGPSPLHSQAHGPSPSHAMVVIAEMLPDCCPHPRGPSQPHFQMNGASAEMPTSSKITPADVLARLRGRTLSPGAQAENRHLSETLSRKRFAPSSRGLQQGGERPCLLPSPSTTWPVARPSCFWAAPAEVRLGMRRGQGVPTGPHVSQAPGRGF